VLGFIISLSNAFIIQIFFNSKWLTFLLLSIAIIFVGFIISQLFDLIILKIFPNQYDISNPLKFYLIRYRTTRIIAYSIGAISMAGIWINCFIGDNYYSFIFLNILYSLIIYKMAESFVKLPKATYVGLRN
jgi:hypothetical protein